MSEVLPLLLLPAVIGWCIAERRQRQARTALAAAVARSRAPMLADAGGASVVLVARSLQVQDGRAPRRCPWWIAGRRRTAWEVRELAAPLALDLTEVIRVRRDRLGRPIGFAGASRFHGTRHGRRVAIELGVEASTLRLQHRAAEVPQPFVLRGDADGRLHLDGTAPLALSAALETLTPSRHWRGVEVHANAAALTIRRDASTPASWLHDLWLIEFVADMIGATAPTARPVPAAPERAPEKQPRMPLEAPAYTG